jgi:hypothetical protein
MGYDCSYHPLPPLSLRHPVLAVSPERSEGEVEWARGSWPSNGLKGHARSCYAAALQAGEGSVCHLPCASTLSFLSISLSSVQAIITSRDCSGKLLATWSMILPFKIWIRAARLLPPRTTRSACTTPAMSTMVSAGELLTL